MIVQSCITDLPPPADSPPSPWKLPSAHPFPLVYSRLPSGYLELRIPRARVVTRRFDQSAFDNF